MSRYAEGTEVSVERSRAEIETILRRYGADQFLSGWRETGAMIAFRAQGRHIRFLLPLPDPKAKDFTEVRTSQHGSTRPASTQQAHERWERACRQRWRALALCIKAKLETVETGISQFEDEFMANIVLPNGETMSEHARPLIARAYETGKMPPLLPHLP
jgi:hypothetical protein